MKLSKAAGFLSNKPVYALIAIYIPMIILTSFLFLLQNLLLELVTFQLIYPAASGFITALAATFYCDFMKDRKSGHIAANTRGGIIVILIPYLFSSILFNTGSSLSRLFFPNLHNFSCSVTALYVWNSVISLKQLFSARKLFDKYTELYHGVKLQEALSADLSVLSYNDQEITRVRNSYILQLVLISLILIMNAILKIPMSLTLYLLMILVLESVVCFFGFIEIFRWEQYYAGEGMTLPPFDRIRRILGIGILSALCIIFAILWSSDKSVFKFSRIIDFIKWLLEFFRRTPKPKLEINLNDIQPQPPPPVDIEVIPEFTAEKKEPFEIWMWLQYAFVASGILGFFWFMISPLFNMGKSLIKLTLRKRLGQIIKEWSKGVFDALLSFIAFIRNDKTRQKLRIPSAEEIHRTAETILGTYSHAKKQDIRHSATLFAQLIIWGSDVRQVTWKPSHAPGEYCGLLAAAQTAFNAQLQDLPSSAAVDAPADKNTPNDIPKKIVRCGEIFEKALYSAEVLSGEERKEFKQLVEDILTST
jgi:hypothetical protein